MKNIYIILTGFILMCQFSVTQGQSNKSSQLPHLKKNGAVTQLMVDGKPWLSLAGELHNSSSSSPDFMKPIWPKLKAMNLNTVLSVVSWQMVEKEEGKFDWTAVDDMIHSAREQDLRLMLLWFGSWKNGMSHYVPDWVKQDYERFPRVKTDYGTVEILSTISEANLQADAKAFSALMQHIKKIDAGQNTVIMVQVQNEVGLHGDSRDRSPDANLAFNGPVPRELMTYLQEHRENLLPELRAEWKNSGFANQGTWEEVFGSGPATDEIFMVWNYAKYVGKVAEAGKAEYNLPMFVNAWIPQPHDEVPGTYPSGGPVAHMLDIWRAGAPQIDILAPDIYLPNFDEVCGEFTRNNNTLFVPESRGGRKGVSNLCLTIGKYSGMGYSPFGIDRTSIIDNEDAPIPQAYGVIKGVADIILKQQAEGTIAGVFLDRLNPSSKIELGDYILHVEIDRYKRSAEEQDMAYGIFMNTGPDEYLILGSNLQVGFSPNSPGPPYAGLATVQEGIYENGKWVPGRTLNGDAIMITYDMETMAATSKTGTGVRFMNKNLGLQKVSLYRFE